MSGSIRHLECASAVIEFADTPPLLGLEFRFLSSVTFDDEPHRPLDRLLGRPQFAAAPPDIGTLGPYPTDFHDGVVNASARIKQTAQALQDASSAGDAATAAQLFTPDAVFEDMALHTRIDGGGTSAI
ncbi:MAG: hypothetical protein J2P53_09270 [Bradyrhizobiaceae bacterium]|nr:hypothetical protein [Bradyrhizobiaceae bacterium]